MTAGHVRRRTSRRCIGALSLAKAIRLPVVACAFVAAMFGAPVHADDAPAAERAKQKFESFASSFQYMLFGSRDPANVTCYLTNVGEKSVTLKNARVLTLGGSEAPLTANTCGDGKQVKLAPQKTCFFGLGRSAMGYACAVEATDAGSLRGEIELRDDNAAIILSAEMTGGVGGASDGFKLISSPAFFGRPDQDTVRCEFTNVGKEPARIRKVSLVRSTGEKLSPVQLSCPDMAQAGVSPGATCSAVVTHSAPATDLRCQAEVEHRADIRAIFVIYGGPNGVANSQPLR